jgi:hypothetical protein
MAVEAFAAANACLFDFGGRRGDHRYMYRLLVYLRNYLSGWWDLNPRPVAAATALGEFIEILSAFLALVIALALCRFCPGGKAFAVD